MHIVDKLSYDYFSCMLYGLILFSSYSAHEYVMSLSSGLEDSKIIHYFELFISNNGYEKNSNLNMYAHY